MITLPKSLTSTKYKGYFWDVVSKKLYSIKTGGLKQMKKLKTSKYNIKMNSSIKYYFIVSVKGQRKYLVDKYLKSLKLTDSIIPM